MLCCEKVDRHCVSLQQNYCSVNHRFFSPLGCQHLLPSVCHLPLGSQKLLKICCSNLAPMFLKVLSLTRHFYLTHIETPLVVFIGLKTGTFSFFYYFFNVFPLILHRCIWDYFNCAQENCSWQVFCKGISRPHKNQHVNFLPVSIATVRSFRDTTFCWYQ